MPLPTLLWIRSRPARYAGAGSLFLVVMVSAALLDRPSLTAWLALALSIAALAVAVIALVKLRLLEFCPQVLAGDVILARSAQPREGARILLPLQFANAGYADGLVEWLALRLTVDDDAAHSILLSPVGEVDMQRFIQGKRRLSEENTLQPFVGFALEGKRALAKFVLFDVAERPRAAPLQLRPGRYSFELFIKASHARQPRLEGTFEHALDEKQLADYRAGVAVYLINYHITLPAIRRALADSEWMPARAA